MSERGIITGMEGHVYIVEFESGMVKVGYSAKPENRFRGYVKNGVLYGNPVTRTWVSPAHFAPQRNERLMIAFCAARGSLASGGKQGEYFVGVPFLAVQRYAASLKFEPFDRDRWERGNAEKHAALRALWGRVLPSRHVQLPDPSEIHYATLGEWFAALDEEGGMDDFPESIAHLFDVDLDDLLEAPAALHRRVMDYAAELVTRRRDVQQLEQALEAARLALSEHTDIAFTAVRQEVQDAIAESALGLSDLRRVRLPDGSEALIRVRPDLAQEDAERLAAEYWQPGG